MSFGKTVFDQTNIPFAACLAYCKQPFICIVKKEGAEEDDEESVLSFNKPVETLFASTFKFVEGSFETRRISKKQRIPTPSWLNLYNGLFAYGTCINDQCDLFEKRVVANFGNSGVYLIDIKRKLKNAAYRPSCPCCKTEIDVKGYRVNNCRYRYGLTFLNEEEEGEEGEIIEEEKRLVNDSCYRATYRSTQEPYEIDDYKDEECKELSFVIEVAPIDDDSVCNETKCLVCHVGYKSESEYGSDDEDEDDDDNFILFCGCRFHPRCIKNWFENNTEKKASCPSCEQQVERSCYVCKEDLGKYKTYSIAELFLQGSDVFAHDECREEMNAKEKKDATQDKDTREDDEEEEEEADQEKRLLNKRKNDDDIICID
jgi:hypothetical protein